MEFTYFKNPTSFAFLTDQEQPCSICKDVQICFDTGGYAGVNEIDCICTHCLKSGKLKSLEIEANQFYFDDSDESIELTYMTPALPTWQETIWPCIDGEFPVFEKIASKQEFENKDEFINTYYSQDNEEEPNNIDWLWEMLPEKTLKSYKDAHDISVYLFTKNGEKYWVWDAN